MGIEVAQSIASGCGVDSQWLSILHSPVLCVDFPHVFACVLILGQDQESLWRLMVDLCDLLFDGYMAQITSIE